MNQNGNNQYAFLSGVTTGGHGGAAAPPNERAATPAAPPIQRNLYFHLG